MVGCDLWSMRSRWVTATGSATGSLADFNANGRSVCPGYLSSSTTGGGRDSAERHISGGFRARMGPVTDDPDAEVFTALRLRGNFTPAEITRRLGLEPSSQVAKGDAVGQNRRRRIYQHSSWCLESTTAVSADTIEPHLDWLLDVIEPKATELDALRATGITCDVDCYWASVGRGGGPWVSPESMSRLGALGLPLVISFYAVEHS